MASKTFPEPSEPKELNPFEGEDENRSSNSGLCFQDIWMRVYTDAREKLSTSVAAEIATKAVQDLPDEVKQEIISRHATYMFISKEKS